VGDQGADRLVLRVPEPLVGERARGVRGERGAQRVGPEHAPDVVHPQSLQAHGLPPWVCAMQNWSRGLEY
jgi:hypothetical protein